MKKALIAVSAILLVGLAALVVYLLMDNRQLEQERLEMQELAELDKQEMENDYERLSLQYSEMMTQINNDSIIAQLTQEHHSGTGCPSSSKTSTPFSRQKAIISCSSASKTLCHKSSYSFCV